MRIIHWHLSIGYANANREDTIEVEDDATEEDIDAQVHEAVHNFIEYGWWRGEQK